MGNIPREIEGGFTRNVNHQLRNSSAHCREQSTTWSVTLTVLRNRFRTIVKLRVIIIHEGLNRNYSRGTKKTYFPWGEEGLCISPQGCSWPKHQMTKFLGCLWGTKIALGVGVNLLSYSSYSLVLSSDPGSDWSSNHNVKKAYVTSF